MQERRRIPWDGTYDWEPYVPVAERRRRAMKKMDALRKKGVDIQPVQIDGRKIARTFWGEAWCNHLESFSDLREPPAARPHLRPQRLGLPPGDRQGPDRGQGHRLGTLHRQVSIKTLPAKKWNDIKRRCSGPDRLAAGTAPGPALGSGDGAW